MQLTGTDGLQGASSGQGRQTLVYLSGAGGIVSETRDASRYLYRALAAWNGTSFSTEPTLNGQIYDMLIGSGTAAVDSTFNYDAHNWYVIGCGDDRFLAMAYESLSP